MVEGTAGSNGARSRDARDDRGRVVPWSSNDPERWPVSAVCAVAVLVVLVLLLLIVNVLGLRLFDHGHYDPDTGGSVAEWFGALATLVALPAAVLFGVRQLQSSGDAILLGQRQLEADQAEREERRTVELARLRSAVDVAVVVANVVDDAGLATSSEAAAVAAWRDEYRQRGWSVTADGAWEQGAARRTAAELLTAEPGPLLPAPWFVAVRARNTGADPIGVQRWSVIVDGTTAAVAAAALDPGGQVERRLGAPAGLPTSYADRSEAQAAAHRVVQLLDVSDTTGRTVRVVHPPPE